MLDLERLLYVIPALLIAITIHEFSHAFAAYRLGDSTAKALGRLTLNPLRHLDPVGTIMILFTAVAGVGIGWGKPVPVNPYNLRINPKNGMALVSLAGPVSNILTAFILVLPFRLGIEVYTNATVLLIVYYTIAISIGLAVFNLLPLPPLDGFSVAIGALPYRFARVFARLEQIGPGLLMLLLLASWYTPFNLLGLLLSPLRRVVEMLVFG